jgi:hypothetical protein
MVNENTLFEQPHVILLEKQKALHGFGAIARGSFLARNKTPLARSSVLPVNLITKYKKSS